MKPLFLDCPGRYTRSSNVQHDAVRYAASLHKIEPNSGYGWLWWACMAVICVCTLAVIVL